MSKIVATTEIRTRKGMLIAEAGDAGMAMRDAVPADRANVGKVLVRWGENRHSYWVEVDKIRFLEPVDPARYVSAGRQTDNGDSKAPVLDLPRGKFRHVYDFGSNLRLIRRARRLSQGALCSKMGKFGLPLAQSTISYHEANSQTPGPEFLRTAARALEVPPFLFLFPVADLQEYHRARRFLLMMSSALAGR